MGSIDDFKTQFGYGARTNLFEVEIAFPAVAGAEGTLPELFKFTCHTASLPETRTINTEAIAYQGGDKIIIAQDKSDPGTLSLSAYNDENFAVTNAFRNWIEAIQQDNTGFRTHPNIYKIDTLKVHQLDHEKKRIRTVRFVGAFPTALGAVALAWSGSGISNAEITIAYDYWRLDFAV